MVYLATDEECVTGEVRLVGGVTNSSSGLLEVCGNGRWGTVCNYKEEWNYENAVVVCRQLNLPTSSQYMLSSFKMKLSSIFLPLLIRC